MPTETPSTALQSVNPLNVAALLAARYEGSPWYEDRVGDAALALAEATYQFRPLPGKEAEFYKLNHAMSQASGSLRQRATQESAIVQFEQTAVDILGEDADLDFELWVDEVVCAEAAQFDSPCLRTVDGHYLTYEQAAEIMCKLAGDDDPLHYQELLSGLLDVVEEVGHDFKVKQEPVPEADPVPTLTYYFQEVNGKYVKGEGRAWLDTHRPPTQYVWGEVAEEDAEQFSDPVEDERYAATQAGRGDPAADALDPDVLLRECGLDWLKAYRTWRHFWNTSLPAWASQVEVAWDRFLTGSELWTYERLWWYWYNRVRHAEEAPGEKTLMAAVMRAWQPSRADLAMMEATDALFEGVYEWLDGQELDYGSRRAFVDALAELALAGLDGHDADRVERDVRKLLNKSLVMEGASGAVEAELPADRGELVAYLLAEVEAERMWPAQAVKLLALADGLSPSAANDWMQACYNRSRTLAGKLGRKRIAQMVEMRLFSTMYPGIYDPRPHRVLVHGAWTAETVVGRLRQLNATPGKVELVVVDDGLEQALQGSGFTVVNLRQRWQGQAGAVEYVSLQQAAAYATRCWFLGKSWDTAKWKKAAAGACEQVFCY